MNQLDHEIRLLSIAEEDLLEIVTYIAIERPSAANAIADKIEKTLLRLTKQPFLGRVPNDENLSEMGYRHLVVDNYLIFYTDEEKTIWVHRILHGARDYTHLH